SPCMLRVPKSMPTMGMPTRLGVGAANELCDVRPLWSVSSGVCPSAGRYHSIVMSDIGGSVFREVDIWPLAVQGLMSGNLSRAVGGVAGLPHVQTFDNMMSDRKHLVSVLLSFFSLLRLHVCSALLREAERES